ncbi:MULTISPECIES: hypothetical protein [Cyanophyceae]|uniref:DUF928 domain-containing protein n=1 Tax=Leptolyngbya subtilissima DQ-A4 TaxID=2933933 RepID=A0ABV0K8R0_9CYAN|nr:hypothetical protein [Nodosilinea sp. FACHB-141]MBD2110331.1 hypothetical protein [Nodosilinea sp. FACHB-141]
MSNNNWILAGLMTTAMVSNLGLPVAIAQPAPEPSLAFEQVFDFFRGEVRDRRRGQISGSRPVRDIEPPCLINPGDSEILWYQKPLFVLRGDIAQIEVQPQGNAVASPWNAEPTATESGLLTAAYDGEPLRLGRLYNLLIYENQPIFGPVQTVQIPFRVMAAGEERDRVAADLDQLTAELATEEADAEAIAQAKANYFLENELPADALQILFTVAAPSEELVAAREALAADICSEELRP